ncbi:DNA-3-methyladenine glycosylase [Neomicrococcus aestuarii]|uniref:Putative 3-methyladenine DNA glycosylase n=1 Tax=Neomicrococcus aestuarii TaxID=556325 RepID=A0A1L2ZQM1_9MICC|nr:DNA-3-methyladenine glycosylase [Neomicrococcus aestuarii]APF41429.1 hypothetical protein BHE16_11030 [Neomicrococcus aestuarii]
MISGNGSLDFLNERASLVAPQLLGWRLRHTNAEGTVAVELTETEAYEGEIDPASHAYRGLTARTEAMFGPTGRLYMYRSYGNHWACNIVAHTPEGSGGVLLRAGKVVEGLELAHARRERVPRKQTVPRKVALTDAQLARGPGNLAQALGLNLEHYGAVINTEIGADKGSQLGTSTSSASGAVVSLECPEAASSYSQISSGPRVGVSQAADWPWRFWIDGEPSVTAYRRNPRA